MKDASSETLQEEVCPNCDHALHGSFCFHCGQNQRNLNRFFWSLISEAFEDIFSLNSRVSLTLWQLFFRPGFISDEYSKGRRARYVPPLRLYIITSLIFVLFLSLQNALWPHESEIPIIINTEENATYTSGTADAGPEMTDQQVTTEIETAVSEMELTWLSDESADNVRNIARQQAHKAYRIYKEDPSSFSDIMLDTLPPMMFILLPIFAVLLKLTYLFSGRYYTEHLVLALHNHCFLYIGFLIIQLLDLLTAPAYLVTVTDWIAALLATWIPIYLFLSLKIFYAQGLAVTVLKFLFLSIAYVILLSIALILAAGWGFFTL